MLIAARFTGRDLLLVLAVMAFASWGILILVQDSRAQLSDQGSVGRETRRSLNHESAAGADDPQGMENSGTEVDWKQSAEGGSLIDSASADSRQNPDKQSLPRLAGDSPHPENEGFSRKNLIRGVVSAHRPRQVDSDMLKDGQFPVPVSLAGTALPVFLSVPDDSQSKDQSKSESYTGEQAALQMAEHLFFEGLEAAPVRDEADPGYAEWWAASRRRSEEYLRTAVGWDRYNRLNAAAAADHARRASAVEHDLPDQPATR